MPLWDLYVESTEATRINIEIERASKVKK